MIFDNNLSYENLDFKNNNFKKILFIFNKDREIELSEKVINFKYKLINDQIQKFKKTSIDC